MIISAASAREGVSQAQSSLLAIMALHLNSLNYGQQTCPFDGQSYDYIIIGAGTAGCVLASRLVEDKNITVLLIEAGDIPGIDSEYPSLMLYGKSNNSAWPISIQDPGPSQMSHIKSINDMSQGKVIGGSCSYGYLTYNEGDKRDYDSWSKILNCSDWKYKNVLPYFKKSQKLEDPNIKKSEGKHYGENGEIGLNAVSSINTEPYLEIFKEAGNDIVPSLNAINNTGYAKALFTISENIRQCPETTYLVSSVNRPNLYILRNAEVIKIVFDACKNAVGVIVYTKACDNKYIYIKAKIEVLLSAGVANSPKLLMLSGIGRGKHLREHQIHTIAELPVGEGLQHHSGVTVVANFTNKIVPFRPYDPTTYPAAIVNGNEYNKNNEYLHLQAVNYINFPSYLMNYCVFTYNYDDSICNNLLKTSVNTVMMYTIINKQKYKSRGRVLLKSHDFRDSPLVYDNFYSNEEDIEDFAKILLNFFKEVENTESFKKFGGVFKDPMLPKCGTFDNKNMKYLTCYVKYMKTSQHQYSSTCQMGSVVDPRLRVYHVQRLRVVDASVMINPTIGGTLGSTIMIAEKAAAMIKEDRRKYKNNCKKK